MFKQELLSYSKNSPDEIFFVFRLLIFTDFKPFMTEATII